MLSMLRLSVWTSANVCHHGCAQEAAEHGDMVVVRRGSGRGYRSIVYKVG